MKNRFRGRNSAIEVVQCDLDGTEIKTFKSLLDAEMATGVHNGNISHCIKGKTQTAGGFIWRAIEREID